MERNTLKQVALWEISLGRDPQFITKGEYTFLAWSTTSEYTVWGYVFKNDVEMPQRKSHFEIKKNKDGREYFEAKKQRFYVDDFRPARFPHFGISGIEIKKEIASLERMIEFYEEEIAGGYKIGKNCIPNEIFLKGNLEKYLAENL